MNRYGTAIVTGLLLLGLAVPAPAETLSLQVSGGSVYNLQLPLVIRQDGQETIRLNADYDTKPFETPIYYSLRLGWWKDSAAWELEMVHHKLTLANRPAEVEHFSVTHGFNLLTLNRAWKRPLFIWRVGAGVVISHPESTIRGKTFDQTGGIADGYYLSGPTAQVALEKRFYLYKGLYASIEGKYSLSWVRVPVAEGKADLWNSALHGLAGIGIDF
jgi:hypothetical protein